MNEHVQMWILAPSHRCEMTSEDKTQQPCFIKNEKGFGIGSKADQKLPSE